MAWWQKKLLRYALSRTGLLDDKALDPDNLDIALGKKNVVELKDVGLNIKRLSKLAQLPASLRIETARVVSLRLTVPADIYQSSIVAEVDGVELTVTLDETYDASQQESRSRARSPVTARVPSHRKVHRRIPSPPPYDPTGGFNSDDERIPTTEELAKSFLLDEPARERRELEASVVANAKNLEESIVSESSDGDELGTGAAMGLPGFLASFLQGIVDRFQVTIKNVEVTLETEVLGDASPAIPLTLRLHVGSAELASVDISDNDRGVDQEERAGKRQIKLQDLSLNLISDAAIFSELSELPSQPSPAESGQRERSPEAMRTSVADPALSSPPRPSTSSTHRSFGSANKHTSPKSPDAMRASILTADDDRFADARDEGTESMMRSSRGDLDIRPGDDNFSWGSRRSKSNAPTEDLWNSMISEDDLPESMILQSQPPSGAHSSRGDSPNETRTRRDPSPYARSLQSPGSWPRIDDSPERNRYYQSPGSWPAMDQSQHSLYQPMTPGLDLPFEESVDNKRDALEASLLDAEEYDTPPEPSEDEVEDLAASRMFSHEEAKSMYMSAMTNTPSMHIPGGWNADDSSSNRSSSPVFTRATTNISADVPEADAQHDEDDLAYGEEPYRTPGNATPRARTPDILKSQVLPNKELKKASRQLVYIDTISIWMTARENIVRESETTQPTVASTSYAHHNMPGTFSAYSEMSASRRKPADFAMAESNSVVWTNPQTPTQRNSTPPVLLELGTIRGQLDMSCGRLLYRLASKAPTVLTPSHTSETEQGQKKTESNVAISVSLRHLAVAIRKSTAESLDSLDSPHSEDPRQCLLMCGLDNIDFSTGPDGTHLQIATFAMFVGNSQFIHFDRKSEMTTSAVVTEQTPDVSIALIERKTVSKRPVWDLELRTLPVDVSLDLRAVEETFEPFGGLSGILEVGNSILLESGIGSSPPSPVKPAKGVRFEGDLQQVETRPEIKVNGRIGGVCVTLQGSACSIHLRTSSVQAIYREQGAVVTIQDIILTGPFSTERNAASLSIDLSTLRLDYLTTPSDKDLERLLSLLIPSSDKYENDDDILIETLIRQRKKGAIFRASVASVKLNCEDQACIAQLTTLGNELGKLSAVAKYLPEDERPGILTIIRIKDCEARIPVNERFGKVHVAFSDLHCAHVGLPALLALSVGDISASQDGRVELVRPVVRATGSECLPMLMARMLGDEIEPTIKIKLLNVCFEYSVPMILDLTNLDKEADKDEFVAELAKSVANLVPLSDGSIRHRSLHASDSSRSVTKKMNVNLLIHDSAIGLTPQNTSSKALIVFTDAHFSTMVPPEEKMTTRVELRKAGIFVADQFVYNGPDANAAVRSTPNNTATKARLTQALSKQGFVSVGSILAAKVFVQVEESTDTHAKTINVDVKNELVLLETCADSTQTLISTLNGLVPPTPPSKQQKYLTEPMTIEDMMASFTGEAFEKPTQRPQTLFDVEEQPEEVDDDMEFMLDMPDDDGLLSDSEMTSTLYGPIDGILEGVDKIEDADDSEDFPETVESLLEDDPFEMPDSFADATLSDDALRRELNKQSKRALSDKALDLGLYEIEDLGFDALGGNQRALGTQYRFNDPISTKRKDKGLSERDLPFRLKLRDLHVIWNIYDGYDWQRTRDGITQAVERVEIKAEERKARRRQSLNDREDDESVIGDFLFNSIYIGVPSNHDAQELRRQINRNIDDLTSETESVPLSGISKPTTAYSSSGRPARQRSAKHLRLSRSKSHKVAFELKGVSADVLAFPPDSHDVVSSVDVRVKSFEIFDNVPTSTWRKFLTSMDNSPGAREMAKPMMHIEMMNVRTLENFAASEMVIHVSILPLRLHVDQDALDFITRFFEFKEEGIDGGSSASDQPFLQRVEVDTVDLCLDYKPKKVDYGGLRSGHTTEFMNFIILDGANIQLKHAIIYGIKGFEPLHKTLNDIWMPDVKRNQLPTVLAGLAPVRSLVNIGSGLRDVIAVPIREYKKDGRIVRSIQKGAFHFGKTTASELARFGAKIAMGTQTMLQGAEGFLTPTSNTPGRRPSPARRRSSEHGWHDADSEDEEHEHRAISAYADQPLGVLSGLRSARKHLEYDLLTARDALIAVQGEVLESSGASAAAAAIVKHAPTVILRPVIGTSRAVGTALLGVGNQIDRSNLRRVEDKYKSR